MTRIRITGDLARQAAIRAIAEANEGDVVRIGTETRTEQQNRFLHPLLTEIAVQAQWMGKVRPMLQWKTLMVSGHAIATGAPQEMTVGIEGEVVNLRESTAAMSKSRFASLCDYVIAWGVQNGVKFSAPEDAWH